MEPFTSLVSDSPGCASSLSASRGPASARVVHISRSAGADAGWRFFGGSCLRSVVKRE